MNEIRVGVTPGDIVRTTLGLTRRVGSIVALVCGAGAVLCAQPDPRQMSGIPRPDPNLADGLITVRVIRGNFTNNVPDHTVELLAGDAVSTADTDPEGRASFTSLAPGSEVRVATTLDGERLVSRPFATPGRGGVAVLLVGAMDGGGDAGVSVVARPGRVTLGQDSRILIELGEETVEVYYLLDVVNVADGPVEPRSPFELTLPPGAQAGSVLQGSTPRTIIDGPRAWVSGAFAPGITPVYIGYILPYSSGSLVVSQTFPADFDQLLVFVEKWGEMDVVSTLIDRRGEMAADDATGGLPLLWGAGARVAAGQPIVLELAGLPHHSSWPQIIALSLSGVIVAFCMWGASGVSGDDIEAQRVGVLHSRREKLFGDLVKTEQQHRHGTIGATRYGTRRAELIAQLERVLRDLDEGLAPAGQA